MIKANLRFELGSHRKVAGRKACSQENAPKQWTLFMLNVRKRAYLVTFSKPSSSNQVADQIRLYDLHS